MLYLEEYIKEELKIQPLGELNTEDYYLMTGEPSIGVTVLINHKDIGLKIWYADYIEWLEKKILNRSI